MRRRILHKIKRSAYEFTETTLPRMKAPEIYGAVVLGALIFLVALLRLLAP